MTRARSAVVAALAVAVVAALSVAAGIAADRGPEGVKIPPTALLPDLDPSAPIRLEARIATVDGKRRTRMSFASAAENVGAGPLVIRGVRTSIDQELMTAEQVIRLPGGSTVAKPQVGTVRYIVDPTHQHWHLEPFMIYELRREKGFALVRPDEKTGFCLGDRYPFDADRVPVPVDRPEFLTNCGLGDTGLLNVEEGISPGYGDDYHPWLDGQWIDITGLRAGRYVLVHRVNKARLLAESSYANNASSLLVALSWPTGKQGLPKFTVLRTCPNKARCTKPR